VSSAGPVSRRVSGSRGSARADWGMRVGVLIALVVVATALLGPLVAPFSPTATLGVPGQAMDGSHLLGLDFQGRDVLSRLLNGGRSTLALAALATVMTYGLGIAVGLVTGFSRSWLDAVLMRGIDVLLSLPALLVMLLCVTGLGKNSWVLVVAATLVLFPGAARVVRSATVEVAGRGFVEAATARGERAGAVLRREILPNILPTVIADLGVRFSWSIILIASVNFLGLGIKPPASDWGVMISENRVIVPTNVTSVAAPAVMLALLIIAVNLIGDGLVRRLGRSGSAK
jgi:peptide/nickel transport system permease protein